MEGAAAHAIEMVPGKASGSLVTRLRLLMRRRRSAAVRAQHHTIEAEQPEDRQRLVAQTLDDDAPALGPYAFVERNERADTRAVDHTEGREIDLHDLWLGLDQLFEIGTQVRHADGVELPFDREVSHAAAGLDVESHVAPSLLRAALERSRYRLLKVSRLGRPERYAISMNDCMM